MIIDNFLPDIALVKQFIADTEYGEHNLLGKTYTGFGKVSLPVKALIEEVMGPVSIRICYLRKGAKDTPLTYNIHADLAAAKYAFVLCLSEPDVPSGTMFWKHKETGLTELPFPTPPELFLKLDADLHDVSKWEQVELIESKENRAVIFESARFHSRWPMVIDSEKPRIVCTAFFEVNADLEKIDLPHNVMPALTMDALKIKNRKPTRDGILPWEECLNVDQQDVIECNAVSLKGAAVYLDHDHLTAEIETADDKKWFDISKFILSMGYTPLGAAR
jgi:hypothetical protein